ncbi:MAG TPA: ornithine carbamoyltransferase [Spirochaetota bacterium]|nr:ornithine carbamoyltransferase [Spirochaetota bacterium]HPQ53696.1 ornithine carbamoyltransferase [Spirochaetota bacterium]
MKIPALRTKDLLTVTDCTREEILELFTFAEKLKARTKSGRRYNILKGKTLAMVFEKSSTRTRVSFETGILQLGGHALFLSKNDIQLGRGETIGDTAQVLSRYVDGIMLRTFSHDTIIDLAENASIPVINGLSDSFHPCQALTDFFTIYERTKDFSSVKLAYVGDGNNVACSLLLTAGLLGVDYSIACPKNYMPDPKVVEEANKLAAVTGATLTITSDIDAAVQNANYLYTDVWVSMGMEKDTNKRKKAFSKYQINRSLLNKCAPGCLVLHCLPAHRGEEITDDVMDSPQSIVFDQAENRMHLQKALMCALMGKNRKGVFSWI